MVMIVIPNNISRYEQSHMAAAIIRAGLEPTRD